MNTTCPHCGVTVAVPDSSAGLQAQCGSCGQMFEVPLFVSETVSESVSRKRQPFDTTGAWKWMVAAAVASAILMAIMTPHSSPRPKGAAKPASPVSARRGLVLLADTVEGVNGSFGFGKITGVVLNDSDRLYSYAQVIFTLYDEDGAQIGSAFANINNLEPNARWKFEASSFGTEFAKYKFAGLTAF